MCKFNSMPTQQATTRSPSHKIKNMSTKQVPLSVTLYITATKASCPTYLPSAHQRCGSSSLLWPRSLPSAPVLAQWGNWLVLSRYDHWHLERMTTASLGTRIDSDLALPMMWVCRHNIHKMACRKFKSRPVLYSVNLGGQQRSISNG